QGVNWFEAPVSCPPRCLTFPPLAVDSALEPNKNRSLEPAPLVVHLHLHTHFSFGLGVSSPEVLARAAAERGFTALACTDTNAVYGVVEFQRACEAAGVRLILGAHLVTVTEETVALATDDRGRGAVFRPISREY